MTRVSFFLTIFILLFFTTACSTPNLSGKKVKKEYFTGGSIRSEFIMNDESGRNGLLKKYGYEGYLTSTVPIRNGMKNGIEIWYDKQGHVLMRVPYVNDKKEGIEEAYYTNGTLMLSTTYRHGIKDGKAIIYTQDGTIFKEALFVNGKMAN